MKLTPALKETFQALKENTLLYKLQHVHDTPHRFGPAAFSNTKPIDEKINGTRVWNYPNRQSLNKLVMLGYAEYQDKDKTIIKYIDKDAAEAELKRKAAIYDRIMNMSDEPLFEDITNLDLLGLSENEILELDNDEVQLLYNNLVSMIYKALAEIEELEKEYEELQNHIENIRGRL